VSVGGLAVQAGEDSVGNVSVPTLPLGATPPLQLVVFDQLEAPVATGVAPLQVKSVGEGVAAGEMSSVGPAPGSAARARRTQPDVREHETK
jgi:hypothetical protein